MMKKMLVAVLTVSLFALPCQAEEDYVFDVNDYMITAYQGMGGDVVIPDTLSGCPVEMIDSSVFYGNPDITTLKMPETLLTIGSSCIYYNDNLTSVTLPESLVAIDEYNFWSCPQLTEITIPSRVSLIGDNSFTYCDNLSSVTFTGAVPHIEDPCFDGLSADVTFYVPDDLVAEYTEVLPTGAVICPSGANAVLHDFTAPEEEFDFDAESGTVLAYNGFASRVDIPDTIGGVPVTAIGDYAFDSNRYAFYVTIPEGVTTIGEGAFASAYHLKYADLPSTLKSIGNSAFSSYFGEEIEFPEGLEVIGEQAFLYASLGNGIYLPEGLKRIETGAFESSFAYEAYFPESIEYIGSRAFADSNVSYLCLEGKELPEIEADAFDGLYISDVDLNWQASKAQMEAAQAYMDGIGQETRVWRNQNPNTVLALYEDGAVYENSVLAGYTGTEPNIRPFTYFEDIAITAVGDGAFKENQNIKYFAVDHGDMFTTIGAEAFADSTLEYIDLFDSVTTIGAGAFRNCANMTELILPESITEVGEAAFEGCSSLTTVTMLCDPSVIPEGAFAACDALENVYVPADAAEEQVSAAGAAAGLPWYVKAVRIGEENPNVFYEMPYEELSGEDFWYDEEYERLDNYQGYEVNLYLPREIDGIPMHMVGGSVLSRACSYEEGVDPELPVRSVVIPETVTDIPEYAFADCPTLETVICYAPLDYLKDSMFANCKSLREVVFVNGVREIGYSVFAGCTSLETVYVGEFVAGIQEGAFEGSGISASDCITDRAAMPDVDALLAAVKSEPIPEPETEPPFELPPFDAQAAAPFIGNWRMSFIMFDDTQYDPAEFEMDMDVLLREDGTVRLINVEADVECPWSVENGTAMILMDGELFMTLEISEGDTLVYREGDDEYAPECYLERIEGSEVTAPAAAEPVQEAEVPVQETAAPTQEAAAPEPTADVSDNTVFGQKYICKRAKAGDYTMEAAALGGEYSVTFYEDGSLDFVMAGTAVPGLSWAESSDAAAYSVTYFDGSELNFVKMENGFELNFFDSMLMYFEP